jgi:hypothetical protein
VRAVFVAGFLLLVALVMLYVWQTSRSLACPC